MGQPVFRAPLLDQDTSLKARFSRHRWVWMLVVAFGSVAFVNGVFSEGEYEPYVSDRWLTVMGIVLLLVAGLMRELDRRREIGSVAWTPTRLVFHKKNQPSIHISLKDVTSITGRLEKPTDMAGPQGRGGLLTRFRAMRTYISTAPSRTYRPTQNHLTVQLPAGPVQVAFWLQTPRHHRQLLLLLKALKQAGAQLVLTGDTRG